MKYLGSEGQHLTRRVGCVLRVAAASENGRRKVLVVAWHMGIAGKCKGCRRVEALHSAGALRKGAECRWNLALVLSSGTAVRC